MADIRLKARVTSPLAGRSIIRAADVGWGKPGVAPNFSASAASDPTRLAPLDTLPASGEGWRRH